MARQKKGRKLLGSHESKNSILMVKSNRLSNYQANMMRNILRFKQMTACEVCGQLSLQLPHILPYKVANLAAIFILIYNQSNLFPT